MKIKYKILNGWKITRPKKNGNFLRLFYPLEIPSSTIMPGEDVLIPTGLMFPGIYREYLIIALPHVAPNNLSDIHRVSKFPKTDNPVLHLTAISDGNQLFIHYVNLGTKEIVLSSGTFIGNFFFSPIIDIDIENDQDCNIFKEAWNE